MTEDYPIDNKRKTKNDKKAKIKARVYKKGGHSRSQTKPKGL